MTAIAAVSIGVDESAHYGGSCASDYGFTSEALAAVLDFVLMCGMLCTMSGHKSAIALRELKPEPQEAEGAARPSGAFHPVGTPAAMI